MAPTTYTFTECNTFFENCIPKYGGGCITNGECSVSTIE